MKGNWKELIKEKNLFKTSYCLDCQQVKSCGKLNLEYCCRCFYQNQQEKWTDYLTAEKALSHEKQHQKEHQRNLCQLAKEKTIENRMEFADWKKFYQQKSWGINLEEWLREKRVLPIDIQCAKQWRKDKGHLPEKCGCLERKVQELHEYFTNCLERDKEKLEKCQCEVNEKVRVSSDNYACKLVVNNQPLTILEISPYYEKHNHEYWESLAKKKAQGVAITDEQLNKENNKWWVN